jgi:hypothetical protein
LGDVTLSGLSGALPIANGGTGATTQAAALSNVLGTSSVPFSNGGTCATSASVARMNLGLGSAATVKTGTSGATAPLLNGANNWAAAQPFSARPTFNGAVPWDASNLANPTQTGAPASFATLAATSDAHVYAANTSGQSILTSAFTVVTGWTSHRYRVELQRLDGRIHRAGGRAVFGGIPRSVERLGDVARWIDVAGQNLEERFDGRFDHRFHHRGGGSVLGWDSDSNCDRAGVLRRE